MKMSKKRLNEIIDFVADAALDLATDKAGDIIVDNIIGDDKDKEEDAESVVTTTPSITPTDSTEQNKDDEFDNATLEYILQQIKKNKDKQVQDAQADFAYRQQQAQQIVTDIEDYLKNNKK